MRVGERRARRAVATGVLAGLVLALTVPVAAWAEPEGGVTHEQNPRVPVGASWSEEYIAASGVELHADVLRPAHLPGDAATPVILSIGPYFSHSGMAGDEHFAYTGPSQRFTPFIEDAGLMAAGYTFVYVDLRGFGGSTGCTDWLGAGEQADVVAAVEWAASAPWSTGAVGLYGKSYDATTGLAAIGLQPEGLAAVVAQEPVWNPYNYLVSNGIPSPSQRATPEAYLGIANLPGIATDYAQDGYVIPADTAHYRENAAYELTHPECATDLFAQTAATDAADPQWALRDLPALAAGSDVPLLFTQGTLETNTKPEDMQRFLAAHSGEQRGWIGPWDHVRGDEKDPEGRYQMGRASWLTEVRAFYDEHLRGAAPTASARFFVQDNRGTWRAQDAWPVTDRMLTVALDGGSYLDVGTGDPDDVEEVGDAVWDPTAPTTLSYPVAEAVRLSGEPAVTLTTRGSGNAAVTMWDVAPDGTAVTIDENVAMLHESGTTRIRLKSLDWTLEVGHRLLVSVASVTYGYWLPTPSGGLVELVAASLELPLQSPAADVAAEGARSPHLDTYVEGHTMSFSGGVAPSFTIALTDAAATPDAGADQLAMSGGEPQPLPFAAGIALVLLGAALRLRLRRP